MATESSKLYRTLWRWHFYAGLFCIPFILLLSVTGAIYLFKPQIDSWNDRSYHRLDLGEERSEPFEQIKAAKNHLPGATFVSYLLPENQQQAVVVTLQHEGEKHLVYVNPYSLEILKSVSSDNQFIRIVRTLHGELLLGKVGSVLVELAGCWAIVLVVTGLYLWWPRSASGFAGVVYPRIRHGSRKFLRDLHAVTGFWVAIFALFLLISGLPWSLVWGSAFKEIRSIGKPAVSQDWDVHHHEHEISSDDLSASLTNDVLSEVYKLDFAHPIELSQDRKKPTQWKLSSQNQNRTLRADAWFEADGQLVRQNSFSEKSTIDRVIGIAISAHEGQLFGWFNQLLGLLTTMGLLLVSISGFLMWWKRKPSAVLGAPKALPNNQVGRTIFGITMVTAILLPLLAISMFCLFIFERYLSRKMPKVRYWLGIDVA